MIYRSIVINNNYHKYIVLEKASIGVRTLDTSLWAIHPGSLRSGYVTKFMNSFHVLTWCDSKSSLFYCEIYYMWVSFVLAVEAVWDVTVVQSLPLHVRHHGFMFQVQPLNPCDLKQVV